MTPERLAEIKPISDERLAELDHWYAKCQSNSLMFCDQDYLEMRARMRELLAEVERLREALDTYAQLPENGFGQASGYLALRALGRTTE